MGRTVLKPPPFPREHGAWVMLTLPLILGSVVAGARLSAAWLLPPAVVLVFLAHYAAVPVAQRKMSGDQTPEGWTGRRLVWAAIYFVVASLLFAALVILMPGTNRTWLLLICGISMLCGAAYSAASCAKAGRLVSAELLGMTAMALSAPIMALAAGEPADIRLCGPAALAFAYSASTLSYVRAYTGLQQGRRAAVYGCMAAHLAILAALALLSRLGGLSPWWFLPFLLLVARTILGLARPPRALRSVGLREIWVAIGFALLSAAVVSL
jgi:hypothetical protein